MQQYQKNVVFIGDWSNLKRGQLDNNYQPEEYNKEAGFQRLRNFLSEIGDLTRAEMFTPFHDLYGHYEFLRDRNFHIQICPIVAATSEDTTDSKIIQSTLDLIARYDMQYLCIGSGDGHFKEILEAAKKRGIKVAIVYSSERSLSREIREMADVYPDWHCKAGQPMLHLFSPTKDDT